MAETVAIAWRQHVARLALCIAVALTSACTRVQYVSDYCLLAGPLRPNTAAWEAADRQFREQIVAANETGARLCGWKP